MNDSINLETIRKQLPEIVKVMKYKDSKEWKFDEEFFDLILSYGCRDNFRVFITLSSYNNEIHWKVLMYREGQKDNHEDVVFSVKGYDFEGVTYGFDLPSVFSPNSLLLGKARDEWKRTVSMNDQSFLSIENETAPF